MHDRRDSACQLVDYALDADELHIEGKIRYRGAVGAKPQTRRNLGSAKTSPRLDPHTARCPMFCAIPGLESAPHKNTISTPNGTVATGNSRQWTRPGDGRRRIDPPKHCTAPTTRSVATHVIAQYTFNILFIRRILLYPKQRKGSVSMNRQTHSPSVQQYEKHKARISPQSA